jgi:peptidylprolyl isomerase
VGHDGRVNRRTLALPVLALALVVGACSSDDEEAVDASGSTIRSGTTVAGGGAPAVSELSLEACVDQLVIELNATDTDSADAMEDLQGRLAPYEVACGAYPGEEIQAGLEGRRDELSEGAQALVFPEGESAAGDAAGMPCVEPVEDLGVDIGDAVLPTGPPPTELVVTDIVQGSGAEVAAGATVEVDYVGYSCSTGAIFDSSYQRGEPIEFGLDQVIPGWSDGLVGMQEGGRRLLVIPSEQGYGAAGSPPSIAPNETLVFVVEVHEVVG